MIAVESQNDWTFQDSFHHLDRLQKNTGLLNPRFHKVQSRHLVFLVKHSYRNGGCPLGEYSMFLVLTLPFITKAVSSLNIKCGTNSGLVQWFWNHRQNAKQRRKLFSCNWCLTFIRKGWKRSSFLVYQYHFFPMTYYENFGLIVASLFLCFLAFSLLLFSPYLNWGSSQNVQNCFQSCTTIKAILKLSLESLSISYSCVANYNKNRKKKEKKERKEKCLLYIDVLLHRVII